MPHGTAAREPQVDALRDRLLDAVSLTDALRAEHARTDEVVGTLRHELMEARANNADLLWGRILRAPGSPFDAVPADGSDLSLPLPAAQEAAWSKAAVAAPGTSAAPATLEANLADAQTAASDVAAAEARAAAAFAEAERVDDAIDAGSGAAVPAALVAPLAEDTLRDAGAPGGGES